jgi:hypothetical protein
MIRQSHPITPKRGVRAISVCLFLVIPLVQGQPSTGTYTTYIAGRGVLTESYSFTSAPDGTLKAEAEIVASGIRQRALTVAPQGKPGSFSIEAGGVKQLSAEFHEGTIKLQIGAQAERELKTKAAVFLENLVWHHFLFLLNQYDVKKGGPQTFTAFLPTQAVEFDVRVEHVGSPSYVVGGKPVTTERYRVTSTSGPAVDIWTDEARVPHLFNIETQAVKAVRQGSEELADAILAAAKPSMSDPFHSEEVTFQNGEVTLAGALTIPKTGIGRFPAAVLISGSGGQDRDGKVGVAGLYQAIAERLSSNGIAVLRHDDRGVGKSTMPTKPTSYRDLINDSKAGVEYLRRRKEIDPDRIALVGHSEGGATATIIASEDARIAAVVLLAGASLTTLESILVEQTLYQVAIQKPVNPSEREKWPELVRRLLMMIDEAKSGKADVKATDLNEYFRQHLKLDLPTAVKRLRCPALILQGERDANVLAHHAITVAQALADAGNKQVVVRIFPNLSHSFMPSPLDKAVPPEHRTQISQEFLDTLQQWVVETLRGSAKN